MTTPTRAPSLPTNIRAKRLAPTAPFIAQVQTIGALMAFTLPVDNVSRTGLLLNSGRNRKVPYRLNTLIELTIDPARTACEQPVRCLGKVVRLVRGAEERTQYGIQIIHIEMEEAAAWDKALAALEASEPPDCLPAAG